LFPVIGTLRRYRQTRITALGDHDKRENVAVIPYTPETYIILAKTEIRTIQEGKGIGQVTIE
jgi:hypothetical protein